MRKVSLIPRVRVNYTWGDLLASMFVRRNSHKYTDVLESLICSYFNKQKTLLTSSGRSALYYVLLFLKQKKVIIPSYTCKVVTEAALLAGKEITYVDVDFRSFNSLQEHIKGLVNSDSIFIATHQYGMPCNIKEIVDYCHMNGCIVIEDCAAALGAKYNGQLVGIFGDYSFFSFDSSKLISIPPKGGFILAKNDNDIDKINLLHNVKRCSLSYKIKHILRGAFYLLISNKYVYRLFHYVMLESRNRWQLKSKDGLSPEFSGFYTHGLYDWQAYIAVKQFKEIAKYIIDRQHKYSYYHLNIKNQNIVKPIQVYGSCMIRYAVLVQNKDLFYKTCVSKGVDCAFSFSNIVCPDTFSTAQRIANEVIDLPFYYNLSKKEMKKVVDVINSIHE